MYEGKVLLGVVKSLLNSPKFTDNPRSSFTSLTLPDYVFEEVIVT